MTAPHRGKFPILGEKTYLASHSLGAVPQRTRDALEAYHEQWATQGIEAWDGPWWAAIDDFGGLVGEVLGASEGSVAPMLNATRAMAGVLSALDPGQRSKVVLTDLEFTTSYPLFHGLERRGFELEIVESPDGITVPAERIAAAVDEDTALVHTCEVYFRSGALQDAAAIAEIAHDAGAYALVDGYQSAGVVPVDVQASGVDFYVGGSHKWLCGGPGAGYVYVRPELAEQLRPRLTGWFGLADPFAYEPGTGPGEPAEGARRFLGGTVNVPALLAAQPGIELVLDVGSKRIRERSLALTDRILAHADEAGIDVHTPRAPERRGGMVCLQVPDGQRITRALAEQAIVVDWRPDCGIRVSPHYYNTEAEIDRLFEAISELRG